MRPLALVVAMSRNRVIGRDGKLPWHLPEDLKRFKALTLGHAIIMGRRTYESIGRPLPGRRNLVVSRRPGISIEGCEVVPSLEEALSRAWSTDPEPRVIGGAEVFREALPRATRIHLTVLDREVEGDTFLPEFSEEWREVAREAGRTPGVSFVTLERPPA